jgi:hypothetical protein
MDTQGWGVDRWANHLSLLLNAANPADRYRFDIGPLAIEVSRTFFPDDPITRVIEDDLDGFGGALLPSESGKRWGILYDRNTSSQRRRFTIGHEFGHYLLHRKKFPEGIRCNEAAVDGRVGAEVEREANAFSASILMPLDDFRKRITPTDVPNFDDLGACADRYDVSLTAVILRWLRYTQRRSIMILSTEGYPNHRSTTNSAGRPKDTYTIAFCRNRRPMDEACARDMPNARTLGSGGHSPISPRPSPARKANRHRRSIFWWHRMVGFVLPSGVAPGWH